MILFLFRYLLGDVGLFGIVLVFTDFLLHGVLFCFPPEICTSLSCKPLNGSFLNLKVDILLFLPVRGRIPIH